MDDNGSLSGQVADEIRVMLTRKRMSGRQLAAALGVSQTWMSTRLNGSTPIDLNDLGRIAIALNVDARDLFPRATEGRTVVIAGGERRQTTVAKVRVPVRPHPNGHPNRTHASPGSRRPARISSAHS